MMVAAFPGFVLDIRGTDAQWMLWKSWVPLGYDLHMKWWIFMDFPYNVSLLEVHGSMEFHGCICPKDPKAGTKELTLTRWDPHGSREMIQRILPNKVPKSLPQTPMLTLYVGLKTFKKSQSFFFPIVFPFPLEAPQPLLLWQLRLSCPEVVDPNPSPIGASAKAPLWGVGTGLMGPQTFRGIAYR